MEGWVNPGLVDAAEDWTQWATTTVLHDNLFFFDFLDINIIRWVKYKKTYSRNLDEN